MEKILNKLRKEEKGHALIIVLILLLLGGLIIAPMLAHVGTGLWTGKVVYEERMAELYAADAGVEDAIWKIQNDMIPPAKEQPYQLTVNDKQVWVECTGDITMRFIANILDIPGAAPDKRTVPHQEWVTIETFPGAGFYKVEVT